MAYSNRLLKGTIGYNHYGWPALIMERAKSDNPDTAVLCEVWGDFHECGSMYYHEFTPTSDFETWMKKVEETGEKVEDRYFKGELVVYKGR